MKTEPFLRQAGQARGLTITKVLAQASSSPRPSAEKKPEKHPLVVVCVVTAHILMLAISAGMFPELEIPQEEPDRIIEVFEVAEAPAPLPEDTSPPPEAVPIPDPQALAIPVDPDTPTDPNANGIPESASTNTEPDYVPQFKLSQLPVISEKEFRARVVYPPLAAQQGIEAKVTLLIFTDATGKIRKVTVLKDPGYGFAEAAVKALEGMMVRPAEIDGKPVATQFRQNIPFTLK